MQNRQKAPKGFTLIELVIVIAVIAILAALLVPTILNQTERARASRAKGEVAELAKALARMRTDTGSTTSTCYSTLTNLNATTAVSGCNVTTQCNTTNQGMLCWNGPYMSQPVSNDPWGMPYIATYTPTTAQVQVQSYGPDKANGSCVSTTDDLCVIQ